jgi:hypothetical protein
LLNFKTTLNNNSKQALRKKKNAVEYHNEFYYETKANFANNRLIREYCIPSTRKNSSIAEKKTDLPRLILLIFDRKKLNWLLLNRIENCENMN